MFIIGLTGGIGSGKSTVEKMFRDLDIEVIDADSITHAICKPGEPGYQAITEHFGADILQSNGQIDRLKLRALAFDHENERRWLEQTLHPLIRQSMFEQAEKATSPYCILSIPLLTETQNFEQINRVLVIDAPEELQITRSCKRDNNDMNQIHKIMATQNSREQRLAYADDVILNDGSLEELQHEVQQLHTCYLKLIATSAN